ncbi:protease modulator HflC [Novosphingopyxis iocasae]|uniref:protease modulator HflC n=1 Tax=Novosphingopyxis iocasae TaxID=2762729 RepID=UPI000C5494D8|nr:protease modulator HflC [Novosphingopyxis iocasae]MAC10864.1 protease modulator HflC [Sphingorhabdus sp.]|tara:strand:- start:1776 stop:2630 length:855 start_codon:yes stop_codon:yes gene_type:complete
MNRNNLTSPLAIALFVLAAIILLVMTVSIVPETKQAIITAYGKPDRIVNPYRTNEEFGETPGNLVARIPFIEQIQFIDKRIRRVEMARQEVLSTDQLRLQVDAYARYRITDPLRMYTTIRTEDALGDQLRTILGSSLRNELGKRAFATLLSPERGQVMENIQDALNIEANKYGAQVIDVRIKRADLPEGTPLQSAYERMRTARQQEAVAIRAEGEKQAQIIRADAEAQAARTYAESFGKDPEFYDFYRSMESYARTFEQGKGNTNIVMSPKNEYLRNFENGGGR